MAGPMRTFLYACAFSALADEACGTSHFSQNVASFALELSEPVKAAYPSGRTRMIKGEAPKYFSDPLWPGLAAIRRPASYEAKALSRSVSLSAS